MNRRTRQSRYSYPFIQDILRKTKAPIVYSLVVSLVEAVKAKYNVSVQLVRNVGYSLSVTLQERIIPTYDLQVTLQKLTYNLSVQLQGSYIGVRNLEVRLQEEVPVTYSLTIQLVEGGETSGCISLDC